MRDVGPVRTGAQSPRSDAGLGAALAGSSMMETWNHWRKDGLGSSAIAPLHRNLHQHARKRVLMGVAVSSVVALIIEEGNVDERGQG
jgi:hypothetical protein